MSLIQVFPAHLRSSSPVQWSCRRVTLLNMGERKRRISSSGSVNGGLVGGTLPRFTTQKRKMVESSGAFPHPRPQFTLFVCVPVPYLTCLVLLVHSSTIFHASCLCVCPSLSEPSAGRGTVVLWPMTWHHDAPQLCQSCREPSALQVNSY